MHKHAIDGVNLQIVSEVDFQKKEHIAPAPKAVSQNKFINDDIFGSVPQNKIRFKKPIQRTPEKKKTPPRAQFVPPKNLKKVTETKNVSPNLFDTDVTVGNIVEHTKFGKGKVVSLEGKGPNKKAEIQFASVGIKKLLLQFAKLKIIG